MAKPAFKYFLDRDGVPTARMAGKPGCGHVEIAKAAEKLDPEGDVYTQMFKLGYIRVLETAKTILVDAPHTLTTGQKRFFAAKESEGKEVLINSARFTGSRG